MLKVGDCVIFSPDGTKGIIVEISDSAYHIVWEDHFASWEKGELLELITTNPAIPLE
jgi:hypothetical protein